jgi:hypothetical protein
MMTNPWTELTDYGVAKVDTEIRQYYECDMGGKRNPFNKLKFDIPPAPFYGNVKNSKIVLLNGNPGFDGEEYSEQRTDEFIHDNNECLWQTDAAELFSLKQQYNDTSHGKWWINHTLIKDNSSIHSELFGSVDAYRDYLVRNLSVIEFLGYHSEHRPSFVNNRVLPSQEYSFHLVRQAMRDKKLIVIMRWNDLWLKHIEGLSTYPYYWMSSPESACISENNVLSRNGTKWSDILRQLAEEDNNLSDSE